VLQFERIFLSKAKFDEEKAQLQKEKEQFLMEQLEKRKWSTEKLCSVTFVEVKNEE
jgi:hypothetical protein